MAVVENVESKMGSSDLDNSIQTEGLKAEMNSTQREGDESEAKLEDHQITDSNSKFEVDQVINGSSKKVQMQVDRQTVGPVVGNGGGYHYSRENGTQGFERDMKEMEYMLSKLNPLAEEFVPVSVVNGFNNYGVSVAGGFGYPNGFVMQPNSANMDGHMVRRKKNGYSQVKRRMNSRTSMAQHDDVTEEELAQLFISCGQVVDCRICGDPNSTLRFAFLEFTDEESARAALSLSGTQLGYYPVKVMPSKTAIAPLNPTFLPRSEDEREMCERTIYCTNIDRKITQTDVKHFFESICGEVYQLRLLGDYHHSPRIAFVEFVMAESAIAALNCSRVVLGSLPIRVSPSKTPVRPRDPWPPSH